MEGQSNNREVWGEQNIERTLGINVLSSWSIYWKGRSSVYSCVDTQSQIALRDQQKKSAISLSKFIAEVMFGSVHEVGFAC